MRRQTNAYPGASARRAVGKEFGKRCDLPHAAGVRDNGVQPTPKASAKFYPGLYAKKSRSELFDL